MTQLQLNPRPADPSYNRTDDRRVPTPRATALWLFTALCACAQMASDSDAVYGGPWTGSGAPSAPLPFDLDSPASDESEETAGTNPFVMAAHDPLSTFATDTDTASYELFTRYIAEGRSPDPLTVRLEDFVNYFDYEYPTPLPDAEPPFSVALTRARHPLTEGTTVLRVALQGKAAPEQEKRPANLTFLVDVSGSMQAADKLPLVQQVLRQALDLLEPDDTVAIVTYASDTRVRLEPTRVAERARIVEEIEGLSAGGSTAGASGIQLAYAEASQGFIQGGINHVVLCTDGDFNVGPHTTRELVELITEKRRSGITLTALGFGLDNLNDDMMEAVSNAGNGFYGYIGDEDQAAEYVRDRLLSTMTLIAKDVKVQVEFNPEHVEAYRLLGYENRALADDDFRDDIVDAGEVGAGHRVTALYELVLAGGALPVVDGAPPATDGEPYAGAREVQPGELVRVKLRYKAIAAGETDPAREVVSSLPPAAPEALAPADADLEWAVGVAAFAELLKQSPYALPEQLDALDALFASRADRDPNRAELYSSFRAWQTWQGL